jgi:hypothetical protein
MEGLILVEPWLVFIVFDLVFKIRRRFPFAVYLYKIIVTKLLRKKKT